MRRDDSRTSDAGRTVLTCAAGDCDSHHPIVTEIVATSAFCRAEEYHQNYHQKNPVRYRFYKYNCGGRRRAVCLSQHRLRRVALHPTHRRSRINPRF